MVSYPGRTTSGWQCRSMEVSISPACISLSSEVATPARSRAASQSFSAGKSAMRCPSRGGFLHDIAQDVIPAVPVDHDQRLDARPAQRGRDVPYDRVQGHGGDADRARPGRVLVRAGEGHRRQQVHRVRGRDLPGYRAGDQRVRRQRQERTVLFEAADGQNGDLPGHARSPRPYVLGGVRRHQADTPGSGLSGAGAGAGVGCVPECFLELLMFSRPFVSAYAPTFSHETRAYQTGTRS